MKKYLILISLWLMVVGTTMAQSGKLVGRTWKYVSLNIVSNTDTLKLYKKDGASNTWDLRDSEIKFWIGNSYKGLNVSGDSISGNWQVNNQNYLIVDSDTIRTYEVTTTTLIYRVPIYYTSSTVSVTGTAI